MDSVDQAKENDFSNDTRENVECMDTDDKRGRRKVVNDPVHGHIELHPLCVAIIDTPQFQRLRYLKQLGTCDFVYPAAVHTRFEHSLGVYHLAGLLITRLRERQPELKITDEDVLCVQIAGLCHDLGHGPFSHMFDNIFIPSVIANSQWKHEKGSVTMFKYMYKDETNNLVSKFHEYGLDKDDLNFIEEQIAGPLMEEDCPWPFKGRERKKAFLYDIVANKRNGIDVDKWDYISRDCLHLGMKNNFDHLRFIHFARVISVNGESQICLRDKEAFGIYQMYQTRYFVHKMAYQHRVTSATILMIADALKKANEIIRIPKNDDGDDGSKVKMSECILEENIDAYVNLTDEVIRQILLERHPLLKEARQLVLDLWRRKLYMFVAESPPSQAKRFTCDQKNEIKDQILSLLEKVPDGQQQRIVEKNASRVEKTDVVIELVDFTFGTKSHPIENIYFYSKATPNVGKRLSPDKITHWMPIKCDEQIIRVFLKPSKSDADGDTKRCKALRLACNKWFAKNLKKETAPSSDSKAERWTQTD